MAWKQDLAKLKQQLGAEGVPAPAPKPPPKPAPKPSTPTSLDDEDEVFLSAMGLKAKAPRPAKAAPEPQAAPSEAPATPPPPPPSPETFEEALKDLKGLKPIPRGPMAQASPAPAPAIRPTQAPPPPPAEKAPVALPPEPPKAVEASVPAGMPEVPAPSPVRFQLAAGMAIDVDGVLDLRGHTLQDAMDRLKDRLEDGLVLGWRSLQVILGPEPALHEGLLALLASGKTPMVARFAQAPVPMGGSQAWLLYFTPSQPQS
ncbi:Smr/MutS family protein [Geothrix mesophila]|uniref:Smr/MutS family protein n=1 Tax=Geothrix mesophila TaxID=2922723 RepID=UPI001FADB8D7|nr:Smr/MutS family protein [Geothrix sp. SG198]